MKRIITFGFLVASTLFQMTPHLNAQDHSVFASVPFPFAVGNRMLPPGAYEIDLQGPFVHFENRHERTGLLALPIPGYPSYDGRSRLLFDALNGRYFLRQIVTPSSMTSVNFPKSRLEERSQELSSSTLHGVPADK